MPRAYFACSDSNIPIQIRNALLHDFFVAATHFPEHRAPHGHFLIAVRYRLACPRNMLVTLSEGYFPPLRLAKRRQIGGQRL